MIPKGGSVRRAPGGFLNRIPALLDDLHLFVDQHEFGSETWPDSISRAARELVSGVSTSWKSTNHHAVQPNPSVSGETGSGATPAPRESRSRADR